ncbi:MAG TPA: STAS domain-containing protein [Yeosuana sp.]
MAFKITEQNGTFFAEGIINSSTAESFKNHLQFILNTQNSLVLNIDSVSKIDTSGLLALYKVYINTLLYNVDFKITGKKSNELLEQFNFSKVA